MQNHYSHGWAHAMNSPYQWDKKIASHLGGTRTSMVISWLARIKDPGGLRSQFTYITDLVPTILEAAQLPMHTTIDGIEQVPLNGASLIQSFAKADAPEHHTTQYFEVIANQGIYRDGWMANTAPKRLPWVSRARPTRTRLRNTSGSSTTSTTTSPSRRTSPRTIPKSSKSYVNCSSARPPRTRSSRSMTVISSG